MSCNDYGLLISKQIDHEISDVEKSMLDKHLVSCSACQKASSIFMQNEDILKRSLSRELFGDSVADNVLKKIQNNNITTRRRTAPQVKEIKVQNRKTGRTVPWKFIASAAAVLLFGMTITSTLSIMNLKEQLQTVQSEVKNERNKLNGQLTEKKLIIDSLSTEVANHNKQIDRKHNRDYIRRTGENILASLSPEVGGIDIVADFSRTKDHEAIVSYSLVRFLANQTNNPITIASHITKPEHYDSTVKPGNMYDYYMNAYGAHGNLIASYKTTIGIPAGKFASELTITLSGIFSNENAVLIKVNKQIDSFTYNEVFHVKTGDLVGKKMLSTDTDTELDFSTPYRVLSIIRNAEKERTTTRKIPLNDENGKPVYDMITGKRRYTTEAITVKGGTGSKIIIKNEATGKMTELWEHASIKD